MKYWLELFGTPDTWSSSVVFGKKETIFQFDSKNTVVMQADGFALPENDWHSLLSCLFVFF